MDAIVVPVGGGGMVSGICIAAKALKPDIKIYAAEPLNADDCARSLVAKERIPQTSKNKLAEANLTRQLDICSKSDRMNNNVSKLSV